jgi:hypothetical protein
LTFFPSLKSVGVDLFSFLGEDGIDSELTGEGEVEEEREEEDNSVESLMEKPVGGLKGKKEKLKLFVGRTMGLIACRGCRLVRLTFDGGNRWEMSLLGEKSSEMTEMG